MPALTPRALALVQYPRPEWTTPAAGSTVTPTEPLVWKSVARATATHFYVETSTASNFTSPDTYRSDRGGFEYYANLEFTSRTSGTANQYWAFDLAYGSVDDLFVSVGQTGEMRNSTDGVTWNTGTSGVTSFIRVIEYNPSADRWLYGGDSGVIRYSDNGTSWTAATSNTTATVYGFAYSAADTRWVAAATGGVIRYSTDGSGSWSTATSGTTSDLYGLSYSSDLDLFVAVGASGNVRTSSDGVTWANASISGGPSQYKVIWVPGWSLFISCGDTAIYKSSNGSSWTKVASPTVAMIRLAYSAADDLCIAVGGSGQIWTSANGTDWTQRTSPTTSTIRGLAYSPTDGFVVAAENGGVYTTPGVGWRSLPYTGLPVASSGNSVRLSTTLPTAAPLYTRVRQSK